LNRRIQTVRAEYAFRASVCDEFIAYRGAWSSDCQASNAENLPELPVSARIIAELVLFPHSNTRSIHKGDAKSMHLPDHYLDPSVCAATAAAATATLAGGYWRFRRLPAASPLAMAATAAGIFAAQMINFPVGGGTSGHLLGGALAAILLGPWPSMVVMTIVLTIQCLLFADGGIGALGANVLNMAVIAPLVGWGIYRLALGKCEAISRRAMAAAVAAWTSVMAAALACSLELAASGAHSLPDTLVAMLSIHAVIGVSEALITSAAVVLALRSSRHGRSTNVRRFAPVFAIVAMVALAPLASSLPDGLESVAEQLRFHTSQWSTASIAMMPDYAIGGVANASLAAISAGIVGVVACAVLTWVLHRLAVMRQADSRN
jgi:cobalt/nickel transport system permease protein